MNTVNNYKMECSNFLQHGEGEYFKRSRGVLQTEGNYYELVQYVVRTKWRRLLSLLIYLNFLIAVICIQIPEYIFFA